MIYGFSHFPTDDGRRVEFVANAREMRRVEEVAPHLALNWRPFGIDEVIVRGTPAAARQLVDVLQSFGGESAVSARMLAGQIDDMTAELAASRNPGAVHTHRFPRLADRRVAERFRASA